MVAPAVWLTGALGVCSPILQLMRLILTFKTLDFNFLNFVFMFDCYLYVCLTLSAYLFVFVCYPACPVCFAYNKFYFIRQVIILF